MNSVELVKRTCKEKKIPIYRLEKDLGFANGYINQLRKGTIPYDRLVLIAQYLDVPLDSLLSDDTKNLLNTASSDMTVPQQDTEHYVDPEVTKLTKLAQELGSGYLSLAKRAKDAGIDPEDAVEIVEILKKSGSRKAQQEK